MCKYCAKTTEKTNPIPPKVDPVPCDFMEDAQTGCGEPSVQLVLEYSCEGHLCEEHMRLRNWRMNEGVGEFLRQSGVQSGSEYIPITEPASCDFIDPLWGRRQAGSTPCGRPAGYAEMSLEEWTYCRNHVGGAPEEPR